MWQIAALTKTKGNPMDFNGMNGDIILNTDRQFDLSLGTVDAKMYGYASKPRLTIKATIRVEELKRREEYETIEHGHVTNPLGFAMSVALWKPGNRGIIASSPGGSLIMEHLHTARWHTSVGQMLTLAMLGERWHLNDMNAACAHQPMLWESSKYGSQMNLDGPRCPRTGYKIGSKWLLEELPPHFLDRLDMALKGLDQTRIYRKYEARG